MSALRISAVTVTPVAFADPPLLNSVGVHEPFALRAVVEVRTHDGLPGLGETYADEWHLAALRAAAHAIVGADACARARGRAGPGRAGPAARAVLACGLRNRDDTGYMRRVVPGYERKQPRW